MRASSRLREASKTASDGVRWARNALRRPKKPSKSPQRSPRSPRRPPKRPSKGPQEAPRKHQEPKSAPRSFQEVSCSLLLFLPSPSLPLFPPSVPRRCRSQTRGTHGPMAWSSSASNKAQDAPKTASRRVKIAQDSTGGHPRRLQDSPRRLQELLQDKKSSPIRLQKNPL